MPFCQQYTFTYFYDPLDRPLWTLLPDTGRLAYTHEGSALTVVASVLPQASGGYQTEVSASGIE